MFAFISVVILGMCCCPKANDEFVLDPPRLVIPSVALVKYIVEFECEIYNEYNEPILLKLFKVGNRDDAFGEYTVPIGENTGTFLQIIKLSHEGYFECEASVQNNTNINATVSEPHYLRVIEPVKDAEIFHSGPKELFEGNNLELECKVASGNNVSYVWHLDGQIISPSSLENKLTINRITSEHSGFYSCVATNIFNETLKFTSRSSDVFITVKDLLSKPNISFTVLKEDSQSFFAIITCQSEKGALPITFSLYNNTELVNNVTIEERNTTFRVPVVMDQDGGSFKCHANNGDQTLHSQSLPLKVVPVGGPVTIESQDSMAENYEVIGLTFYCKAAKGSHPRFQWFLNDTLLNQSGDFYRVVDRVPSESILLLSVGRISSGAYRCKVSDSFDNTTAVSSKRRYVNKKDLNRLPTFVVAVVFGCFTFLILLVSFCCLFGVIFRQKQFGEKSLLYLEMEKQDASGGDEEELLTDEEPDEPMAPREDEFYQESLASVDEWPDLEQERKTLEDEEDEEVEV
ncbi:Fc receptor-like protein 5 [Kryptolebias marmoratus]|uniref:Fc receptor-like protein 5 n=1 Tax=Kryptolebias marmoratus TaxID=37003 RepID=UPI0007F872D8|nr:Fc receptor-like protein 5 [Kryptolebias marmoratus]